MSDTVGTNEATKSLLSLPGLLAFLKARIGSDAESQESAFAALKVLIIRCLGAALAYASQVLLARVLGQTEYGIFALVWVWILVLGHLAPLGFAQAVCRFAPHYEAREEDDLLRGFLHTGALFVAGASIGFALIGAAILWFAAPIIEAVYILPFAIALIVFPLFALQDYVENIARAFNWTIIAITPPFIIRHGLIGLGVLGAFLLGLPVSASLAIGVVLLATLVSLLVQTGFVWLRLRKVVAPGSRKQRIGEWFTTSIPLVFVDGTLVLFSNADILILSLFVEPATIAIYFAASRILQLVAFVQYAATAATAQRFTALNALGDGSALNKLARTTTQLTLIVSVAAAATIYLAAPYLLDLFGEGFGGAMPVLAILMVGLIAQAFAGPGEDLMNMLGEERACAVTCVVALFLNVILNFALIPSFGLIGAAVATAVSVGIRSLILTYLVKRKLGLDIAFWLPTKRASQGGAA
jgi:O-antigen/teichoic acid export membrane protein